MKRKLAGAAITMLVAGFAAAGCGGDGKDTSATGATTASTTGPTPPLTKAAFIARADATCEAAMKRIDAAGRELQGASTQPRKLSQAQITTFLLQSTVPSYERMLGELRDLTPPKRDEKAIDGFVASLASSIDAIKANPSSYAKLTTANPFADANKRAKSYGMKVCGS
jgi:hypothetical protein